MKRKQARQWFSVLLTLIVIFSSTVVPSAATNSVTNNDFGITGGIEAPQGAITASEVVSSDNVTLKEDTNLYSKTKRNDDGTYTLELFDVPVKYVDSTGKIKEKTLELKDTASAYVTRQSDISCLFPKDLSAGISLTYGDTLVKMVPDIAKNVVKTQHEDGVVSYLTSDKTLYRYSLTYMGYKEDIIVPDYTGQTEYRFTYYTNGLHMEILNDELVLTDEDDNIVAGFSEVIVFTADDRNNAFGEYRCETVKANEEYRVTIVLDADYLKDEKTAYPIVIDPSLEINYDNNGASAIEDATINSATTTSPNGASIFVGLRSTKGIARLLVKFPGYDFSQMGGPCQVISAQYIMRDLMCYSTHLPVEAHVFKSSWNESTVSWTSTLPNNYDSTVLDTQTVYYRNGNYISAGSTYSNSYAFDITDAVRGWMSGTYNQEAGIMFKTTNAIETGDDYISVCFASSERGSNKPRLIVTYGYNHFYSDYSDAELYRNTYLGEDYAFGFGSVSMYQDDGLQLRANCYGYAFKFFYALDDFPVEVQFPTLLGNTFERYLQQPGEFANKTSNPIELFLDSPEPYFTVTNRSDLNDLYFSLFYDLDSNAERMSLMTQLVIADAATLGYTVTEYDVQTLGIPDSHSACNRRLIAMAVSDIDYHFYIQHSDDTWSHKGGSAQPSDRCIDHDHTLTNANIYQHACEGIYTGGIVKFFYITKDAVIDYGHLRGTYVPTDTSTSDCKRTSISPADRAGNHINMAKELGVIPKTFSNAKIDYIDDVDYYSFVPPTTGTYVITVTMDNSLPVTVELYDLSGNEISSSSADGAFVGAYNFIGNNEYILRISSSNQASHEFLRRYDLSITNG